MLKQITSAFSWNCLFPTASVLEEIIFRNCEKVICTSETVPKEHPLLNTLIVHEVFKYLDFNSITKCREVCAVWNTEACKILKNSKKHRKIPNQHLKTFLQIFNNSSNDFPLTRYSLQAPQLEKIHQIFLHTLGTSRKITSLVLCIPVNELSSFVEYAKPLTCLKQLRLILNSERTVKDCPLFSLQSKTCILLGKRSLPCLTSISITNGQPEKRIYCNYDYYTITLINAAQCLINLEFISWTVSSRLLREVNIEYVQSLRILGNALSETDILILGKKKVNNLKLVELLVDNNVTDNVFEEFVQKMRLKNPLISISTNILSS